ncbi:MAG: chalcone isomerase family protein [Gammaproteobacteria bacterium]|nr:chalcone isomerase family protein [Gammaproteobacteria bacterium]
MHTSTESQGTFAKRLCSTVLLMLTLAISVGVQAKKVGGFNIPDTLDLNGLPLVLNGAGVRTKVVIKVYVGALYLAESSNDAAEIISADEPMAIRLQVRSGFLNRKKMQAALLDGFKKSTGGNTAPIQSEIDQMMDLMSDSIKKKDVYLLAYSPDQGTVLSKNGSEVGSIAGLAFKQALFGIWLSDSPAQASLKKAMLGQ